MRSGARVLFRTAEIVPAGELGEIIAGIDSDEAFDGYLNRPDANEVAIRDGWYYTGDLGVRDEDGYFIFAGRQKDCIRRRGENISAFEIERLVNAHPSVLESAAVGVPSELGEEDVKLSIVPRPECSLRPRDVWEHCRDRLPSFMVPRWVEVRESLPKTATERVRKPDLVADGVAGCWTPGDDL